jgi:uncharacterized peroxidase-related enzyme
MTNPGPTMTYAEFNTSAVAVRDALLALGNAVDASGLDKTLTELMKLRVSQVNGCAFCVQYHLTVARRLAVPAEKLDLLTVWSETDLYSPRERAALAWAEALTRLDDVARATALAALREEFTQTEILNLTATVGTINHWNRIAIGLGFSPQLTAPAYTEAEYTPGDPSPGGTRPGAGEGRDRPATGRQLDRRTARPTDLLTSR